MGFDIYALSSEDEPTHMINNVAYHRAYMGGFRMMREQGYDWFRLIDAEDCDGGVSGNGKTKEITKLNLKHALKILKEFEVTKMSNEGRDEITDGKIELMNFMISCINWCELNEEESIWIYFG